MEGNVKIKWYHNKNLQKLQKRLIALLFIKVLREHGMAIIQLFAYKSLLIRQTKSCPTLIQRLSIWF